MSEFASFVNEATVIGSLLGATGGSALELMARRSIVENEVAIVPNHDAIDTANLHTRGRLHRATATLAVIGAFAGYSYGEFFSADAQSHDKHPTADLIVGHPQTALEDGTFKQVNETALAIAASSKLHIQPLIEHNNNTNLDPTPAKQIKQDVPFGDSTLAKVLPNAITNTYNRSSAAHGNLVGSKVEPLTIVTDDESPGDVKTIMNSPEKTANVPIVVANVGSNNDANAKALMQLAAATHGKYYHVGKNSTATTAASIKSAITPAEVNQPHDSSKDVFLFLGLGLTAFEAAFFARRRKQLDLREGKEDS